MSCFLYELKNKIELICL